MAKYIRFASIPSNSRNQQYFCFFESMSTLHLELTSVPKCPARIVFTHVSRSLAVNTTPTQLLSANITTKTSLQRRIIRKSRQSVPGHLHRETNVQAVFVEPEAAYRR